MKNEMKKSKGFTLVEVLIAVATIGLLAAIALPSYGNYTRRAKAAEGLSLAQPTMNKLRESVTFGEYTPAVVVPHSPQPAPMIEPDLSAYVQSIKTYNLTVIIKFNRAFDPDGQTEYHLVMSGAIANDGVIWTCKSGAAAVPELSIASSAGVEVGAALPTKWAPGGC